MKMITPDKAINLQNKWFENKKKQLESIVDTEITKTFESWKIIVEVKNSTAVNIFDNFEILVKEYYRTNNRNITKKKFKQYNQKDNDSYDDYMLQLEPIKKSSDNDKIPVWSIFDR